MCHLNSSHSNTFYWLNSFHEGDVQHWKYSRHGGSKRIGEVGRVEAPKIYKQEK